MPYTLVNVSIYSACIHKFIGRKRPGTHLVGNSSGMLMKEVGGILSRRDGRWPGHALTNTWHTVKDIP